MPKLTQSEKADRLRSLHQGARILVLPNAWDATSARIFETAGFEAVGTTSAGIAAVLGYPDGQRISRDEMLLMVARIASSVDVPVSADIEAGYGVTIAEVVETVRRTIASGAAGINLEDGTDLPERPLMDLDYQVALIAALRAAAHGAGVPLVINARVDIYLREVGAISGRFEQVVERANAYLAAGADCIFPIGLSDGVKIARLVQQVNGPLNILAGAGAPLITELEELGVRRVSFGSGLMRATLPLVRQMAESLRAAGDYHKFIQHEYTHAVVNRMFAG